MGGAMKKRAGDSKSTLLRHLGLKIMKDLTAKGMSVDAFALEIGIARSTLREITAGRSNPRLLTLVEIAHGLGYPDLKSFFQEL
jgi:transcriptional regulator with XRE-family HTH domain